jgi:hypothetical protein
MDRTKNAASHDQALRRVTLILRRRGHTVEAHGHYSRSRRGDLLIDGAIWLGVRGAHERPSDHTVRIKGKAYAYAYRGRHFNLHAHGKRVIQPDFWCLVELDSRAVYVVPAAVLTGLTIYLHSTEKRQPRNRVRPYLAKWEQLRSEQRSAA